MGEYFVKSWTEYEKTLDCKAKTNWYTIALLSALCAVSFGLLIAGIIASLPYLILCGIIATLLVSFIGYWIELKSLPKSTTGDLFHIFQADAIRVGTYYKNKLAIPRSNFPQVLACIKDYRTKRLERKQAFVDRTFALLIGGLSMLVINYALQFYRANQLEELAAAFCIALIIVGIAFIAPTLWEIGDYFRKASIPKTDFIINSLECLLIIDTPNTNSQQGICLSGKYQAQSLSIHIDALTESSDTESA